VVVVIALAAGCSRAPSASPSSPSSPAAASSPAALPSSSPAWSSAPVTVAHSPSVPPVPVVTGIRSAAHPGYDRIVFDITGPLPGYSARYVDEVRADPSDRPVDVPGGSYLLLVLNPAEAHTLTGVHSTGLATLRAYAIVGDFEGHVSVALGLDHEAGFRIGELPGRIYVDVAN
jgi:hypothetical protein